VAVLVQVAVGSATMAQDERVAPVGDGNPLPRLETSGPTAAVTALAFGPDSKTLYSAGYDKIVRVWRQNPNSQEFELDSRATFRVPIGPGRDGVINVLAVSPDGTQLAVSGLGVYRGGSEFARPGWIVADDALTSEMRQERFLIYVFDTKSRAVALLRGHEEDVLALTFAPAQPGQPQLLISAGRKSGASIARVCVWDVGRASALDDQGKLVERGAKVQEWLVSDLGKVPGEPPPGVAVIGSPSLQSQTYASKGSKEGHVNCKDGKELKLRFFDRTEGQDKGKNTDFITGWLKDVGIATDVKSMDDDALAAVIGQNQFDLFTWGWVPFVDPDPELSYFTKEQATTDPNSVGYDDANWCNDQYDALYKQQHTELDPVKRHAIVQQMLSIFYDDAPYAVLYKYDDLQAFRSDRWENFVRQPEKTGPVLFTNTSPAYIELRPKGTGSSGGTSAGLFIGIGIAVVAIGGGGLWFRSRRKGSVDERE
jgi:hypothetical protein